MLAKSRNLTTLLILAICSQACATAGRVADPWQLRPFQLQVQLNCLEEEVSPEQTLPCRVYLLASPEGGPVLIPRTLPPFRLFAWPDIKLQFEIREAGGAYSPLSTATDADQGRWCISLPLSEKTLLVLRPGELYGWSFDLNGRDWVLPRKDGKYSLRAHVTLRLRQRTPGGQIEPAVSKNLGKHPEYLDFFVPEGTWDSNEVVVSMKTKIEP
jgi:hypothetical protein